MTNVTDKYKDMIEAFECDFALALEGKKHLDDLQEQIDKKENARLLKDIDLLKELSFLLRSGKAEIRVVENQNDKDV